MDKCGIVLFSDLQDPKRIEIFNDMEKFASFLMQERYKWWPDVPWPPDALHQWSRQFEYPFAFHHAISNRETGSKVLDAGSGITFFPFYLAMHGFDVLCLDSDKRLCKPFAVLNNILPERLRVGFQLADLNNIPYRADTFSHIFCVSTLEHLRKNQVDSVLKEFSRVLIEGGICAITVDISLEVSDAETVFTLASLDDFVSNMIARGLVPIYEMLPATDLACLLPTDCYKRNPGYLPWAHSPKGIYSISRHLIKTRILRRQTFKSIGLAVFICKNTK